MSGLLRRICGYRRLCKRGRRNRAIRTIARAFCGLSGLAVLLIVGGLEKFWLPLWPGALWLTISLVVFAITAMKGGLIDQNVRR